MTTHSADTPQSHTVGLLAEFASQDELIQAGRTMRSAGYTSLDAYTPFPIHELDEALGVRPTRLPWLVLAAGLVGGISILAFQWWTNAVDYPMLISGKPLFSLPANIPVTFEVIVLSAAFAAFLGMLALNGLPRLASPLLRSVRFARATSDGFFLSVAATDPSFDPQATPAALRQAGATEVETLTESTTQQPLPRFLGMSLVVVGSLAVLPPLIIAGARSTTSEKPRLHNVFNMDFQPKFKSQTTSQLFADGRAMRPRIPGTVPRGSLPTNPEYEFGYVEPAAAAEPAAGDARQWVEEIPLRVTSELMERGRERFNIHCAVCHGRAGFGNGLVSQRAIELQQGTWVPPTSIHTQYVVEQPVGQLFNTITNGVRKMPAYGHQIPVEDRWAIVLYVRALQRSQQASLEDVPEDIRPTLRELN